VLCCCWLDGRKGIQPVKNEWWNTGMVIYLERGANDLHMIQLMPLAPIISHSTYTPLTGRAIKPQHQGHLLGPLHNPECVCVCVCVCAWYVGNREPCTVFSRAPSLILASFLCAKPRGCPVSQLPQARPSVRPSGESVAGRLPSSRPWPSSLEGRDTASVAWNISVNQQRRQRLNGSLNLIAATCHILKRTQVNPLCLSRNLIL